MLGFMATVDMSPRPTHPPEVPRGTLKELGRRRTTIDYPAPGYYCGLVDNDINNLLTCVNAQAYCMYYSTAAGCCISSDLNSCTDMPTSCIDWGQTCDSSCQNNPRILSCSITTEPYCGTFFFSSGTRLLACFSTQYASSTVVMLKDYFSSELGTDFTTLLDGLTSSLSSSRYIYSTASTDEDIAHPTDSVSDSSSSSTSGKHGGGISGGAIAGIVVGVVAVAAAFAAFLIWVFFVKRKKNNENQPASSSHPPPQPPQSPPPMMQQQQQPYGQGHLPPSVPAGYYVPDGNKPYGQDDHPQRYSSTTTEYFEPGIPEIQGNPIQQQSQPLLSGSAAEYYNPKGNPESHQQQQHPSEIDSTSPINRATSLAISNPGTTVSSVSSPHGGGGGGGGYQTDIHNNNNAGPIYELGTGRS
ncbi:hypothetical protein VTN00DRAFT_1955 [Thermoascus crustaceus]|uniref:uncharacterized protein n=1 Tax=Thermoascus crustaceus TaxID=5088 RepID=UPI003743F3FD